EAALLQLGQQLFDGDRIDGDRLDRLIGAGRPSEDFHRALRVNPVGHVLAGNAPGALEDDGGKARLVTTGAARLRSAANTDPVARAVGVRLVRLAVGFQHDAPARRDYLQAVFRRAAHAEAGVAPLLLGRAQHFDLVHADAQLGSKLLARAVSRRGGRQLLVWLHRHVEAHDLARFI